MNFSRSWRMLMAALLFSTMEMQAEEKEKKVNDPPPEFSVEHKTRSLALLRDIVPDPKRSRSEKTLATSEGDVIWGTLFREDEVVALVQLAGPPKKDEWDITNNELSLFFWQGDHWEFREFLGLVSNYELKHRKRLPHHVVQARLITGRYEAEQYSWRYDEKSRLLVPTGWDEWGAFYIMGDYLCYTRGKERLSHDDTRWVHRMTPEGPGELLAVLDQNDSERFDITFGDANRGESRRWSFAPVHDEKAPYEPELRRWRVMIYDDENEDEPGAKAEAKAEILLPKGAEMNPEGTFEFLTGLSSKLVRGIWSDDNPPVPKRVHVPMKVTGDEKIVERLQWPKPKSKSAK